MISPIKTQICDVVVVGSGAAGLSAALALAPKRVTVLTKSKLGAGSSRKALGGIAAAIGRNDTPTQHAEDTIAAGGGLVNEDTAHALTRDGIAVVQQLLSEDVPFDRDPNGTPLLGREAAHRCARVLHGGGDATGRMLIDTLVHRVNRSSHIAVEEQCFVWDLAVAFGSVRGVLAYHATEGWVFFACPRVILACGGAGGLWQHTTNPPEATADGLAVAARAGADLLDLEFMQFHPTSLDVGGNRGVLPLLTEALRGAGALVLDAAGERIMPTLHPAADLAPRDIVARAVWDRTAAGQAVFLDLRPALAREGAHAFPTALRACRDAGFDAEREPVPITPAAHYHMGGIHADADGKTSLRGVFACGETAATGVHGANRLASNSLLEALVTGTRVARRAFEQMVPVGASSAPTTPRVAQHGMACSVMDRTRAIMTQHVGVVRSAHQLKQAIAGLRDLRTALQDHMHSSHCNYEQVRRAGEARNMVLAAQLIAESALARRESRGAHYRADYPHAREAWRRHLKVRMSADGSLQHTRTPVSCMQEQDPLAAEGRGS